MRKGESKNCHCRYQAFPCLRSEDGRTVLQGVTEGEQDGNFSGPGEVRTFHHGDVTSWPHLTGCLDLQALVWIFAALLAILEASAWATCPKCFLHFSILDTHDFRQFKEEERPTPPISEWELLACPSSPPPHALYIHWYHTRGALWWGVCSKWRQSGDKRRSGQGCTLV